jgi:hypothetical protein
MLTLSALLFATAVAAPRYWWTAPPPPEPKRPVATAPDKPKPPPIPLCKKHPHRCTVDELLGGPAHDYQNGSADGGSSGGY